MIAHHDLPCVRNDQRPALSLLAVGDRSRRAFVDTIRALALIKWFGDRLTLIGYGRHRRSLEKWATALQIDHLVVFGGPLAHGPGIDTGYDIRIGLADDAGAITVSFPGEPARNIACGDRIALANALMVPDTPMQARITSPDPVFEASLIAERPRLFATMLRRLPL